MAKQYDQLKRMREKAARLLEKANSATDPKLASRYLRQAQVVQTSIQAIQDNWKAFAKRAKGNKNRRGISHTREAREKMTRARRLFWKSKKGFQKMWKARRARQFRQGGRCLLRFPRLGRSSIEKAWLGVYRKNYQRITGKHLGRSDIILDPPRETLPHES